MLFFSFGVDVLAKDWEGLTGTGCPSFWFILMGSSFGEGG
jgi:hypothetical protein